MSSKKAHAFGWGLGGAVLTIACVAGMVLSGPVGWVIYGIAAGIGSSTVLSAFQQSSDTTQEKFCYQTLATDVTIGALVSLVTCGIGGTIESLSNLLANKVGKIVAKEAGKFVVKIVAKEGGTALGIQVVKSVLTFAITVSATSLLRDGKVPQRNPQKGGVEQLRYKVVYEVTPNQQLASWVKASHIGICPRFKLVKNEQDSGPFNTKIKKDGQHCIKMEAGKPLEEILEQPEQNPLFLTCLRDQLRQISTMLQESRFAHQRIEVKNFMVIETKLYLIGNDYLREFGKPINVEARSFGQNGLSYSMLCARRNLEQCNQNTDRRDFIIVDNMITEKIEGRPAQQ